MVSAAQVLLELFRTSHEAESVEYVVVNDGSTESDNVLTSVIRALQTLFGARVTYIVHSTAQGFGLANHAGILRASGTYIVLVNSDMFPTMGWLATLLATLQSDTTIAIVGPLFVGKDSIQEAGGIVWRDGTGANYGRFRNVTDVDGIDYARPVDYVSAACLMMARDTYLALGGFDNRYKQGYYEDTDLAMTARTRGLKVVYQPFSVVYHQEGTTLGTDDSPLKQQLMTANRATFVSKWQTELQAHLPAGADVNYGAQRLQERSIMFIDSIAPEPDRDAGSVRTVNLLRILFKHGVSVTFQALKGNESPVYIAGLRFLGVQVPRARPAGDWRLSTNGECLHDAFIISRRDVALQTLLKVQLFCPGVPVIYDTVDIHFLREARVIMNDGYAAKPWDFERVSVPHVEKWIQSAHPRAGDVRVARDAELALMQAVDATWIVSDVEREALRSINKPLFVVSTMHDVPPLKAGTPCRDRTGALFVGNLYHVPNQRAIDALVDVIVPRVRQRLSSDDAQSFELHIVGSNKLPSSQQARLLSQGVVKQGIRFHGHLSDDDLKSLYNRVRVVLAPLTSGAGVKGKVNQAMQLGVPVVTTPIAAEGMFVTDGVDGMVAHSLDEFIDKTVSVYTGCSSLWSQLSAHGYESVRKHFSIESVEPVVLQSLRAVGVL